MRCRPLPTGELAAALGAQRHQLMAYLQVLRGAGLSSSSKGTADSGGTT